MPHRHRWLTARRLVAAGTVVLAAAGCSGSPGSTAAAPSAASPTGSSTSTLTIAGLARSYRLYVPPMAAPGPTALVVALHGGGGTGAHFEQIAGFDNLADSAGFIVAYPDAVRGSDGRIATWNAGDCCGQAAVMRTDDVGFIRALIEALSASHQIDPARIFVAGFSNGGMLAYRIACQLAGTVAAVGVQSATLEYAPCDPAQPVSLLAIHGTADTHVPLAGGHGDGASNADYTPPLTAAATVATADGCASTTSAGADPTLAGAQLRDWTGCPAGVAVQFVTVTGGTHIWAEESAEQIWAFLAAHPRPAH